MCCNVPFDAFLLHCAIFLTSAGRIWQLRNGTSITTSPSPHLNDCSLIPCIQFHCRVVTIIQWDEIADGFINMLLHCLCTWFNISFHLIAFQFCLLLLWHELLNKISFHFCWGCFYGVKEGHRHWKTNINVIGMLGTKPVIRHHVWCS